MSIKIMRFATKLHIGFSLLILMLGLGVAGFVYYQTRTILENRISSHLQDMAVHTLDKITRFVYERRFDIILLSKNKVIRAHQSTRNQLKEELDIFAENHFGYTSISIFDLNRIRLADTSELKLGQQDPNHAHWDDIKKGIVSVATSVEMSSSLKMPTFYFAAPVKDQNNKIFRAIVARVTTDNFNGILKEFAGQFGNETHIDIDLLDKRGTILYSNHNKENILVQNYREEPFFKDIDFNSSGGILFGSHPGSEITDIMAYAIQRPFHDFVGNNWVLLVHFPSKVAFYPATHLSNQILLSSALWIIIALIVSQILVRSFVKPLQKLGNAVAHYGQGKKVEADLNEGGEIGEIFKAFKKMILDREQLDARLQKSKDQIMESKRMASIGELTAGVCHEILNPLNIISLKIQVFSKKGNPGPEQKELLRTIEEQCARIQKTVDHLNRFSQVGDGENFNVQINDVIKNLVELVQEEFGYQNVRIKFNPDPSIPLLLLDLEGFNETLYHLLANAREAMPEGGLVSLETKLIRENNDAQVQIIVRDDGVGIAPENLDKVFEPFYTTKNDIYGSGMGLTVVQAFVSSSEGSIVVKSNPGKGTQVQILLPVRRSDKSAQDSHNGMIKGGGNLIQGRDSALG